MRDQRRATGSENLLLIYDDDWMIPECKLNKRSEEIDEEGGMLF